MVSIYLLTNQVALVSENYHFYSIFFFTAVRICPSLVAIHESCSRFQESARCLGPEAKVLGESASRLSRGWVPLLPGPAVGQEGPGPCPGKHQH